jgi:transposase
VTKQARQRERRLFSREFKLSALQRMEDAGNVSALADELGVRRELLYDWREKFAGGGAAALKGSGRPRPAAEPPEVADGERRIAALERKIGEQALLIDFFRGALQRIEASRRPNDGPGATASSPRSRR